MHYFVSHTFVEDISADALFVPQGGSRSNGESSEKSFLGPALVPFFFAAWILAWLASTRAPVSLVCKSILLDVANNKKRSISTRYFSEVMTPAVLTASQSPAKGFVRH